VNGRMTVKGGKDEEEQGCGIFHQILRGDTYENAKICQNT
jgi:hypothetical protein